MQTPGHWGSGSPQEVWMGPQESDFQQLQKALPLWSAERRHQPPPLSLLLNGFCT